MSIPDWYTFVKRNRHEVTLNFYAIPNRVWDGNRLVCWKEKESSALTNA